MAPSIAQLLSMLLLADWEPSTLAWIDNYMLCGTSKANLRLLWHQIQKEAGKAGMIFKKEPFTCQKTLCYVGMQVDLDKQTWRLDPAWVTKARHPLAKMMFTKKWLSIRQQDQLFGAMFWAMRVFGLPYSAVPTTRAWESELGYLISTGANYDLRLKLPLHVRMELLPIYTLICNNPWRNFYPSPKKVLHVMTDASPCGGGMLYDNGWLFFPWKAVYNPLENWNRASGETHLPCPNFPMGYPCGMMFTLEAAAVREALWFLLLANPNTLFYWGVDNFSLFQVLGGSFKSSNPVADSVLFDIWKMLAYSGSMLVPFWIPTYKNLTDLLSRIYEPGYLAKELSIPFPPFEVLLHQQPHWYATSVVSRVMNDVLYMAGPLFPFIF